MSYRFTFTPEIVLALQSIEAARTKVQMVILPPAVAEGLRLRARIRSTHFSTRIEGNRLTSLRRKRSSLRGLSFRAEKGIRSDGQTETLLRKLDRRARIVLGLFSRQDQITAKDVARVLSLSARQARDLLNDRVSAGWLEMTSMSRKSRACQLSAEYRQFIGGITGIIHLGYGCPV